LYVDVIIKLHIFLLQIHTMAIHEDYLYSAGDDGSIRGWNIKTFVQEKCIEVQYVFQIIRWYLTFMQVCIVYRKVVLNFCTSVYSNS
jgi:WD40 repeat protein